MKRVTVKRKDKKSVSLTFRINPELDNRIRTDANREGKGLTAWVEDAAERKLADPR